MPARPPFSTPCPSVRPTVTFPVGLPAGRLSITPDHPRWIGAWWFGFLLCGALLFCSALFMFGFPHSLPTKEKEEGADSEHVMLPPSLSSDYETPSTSNGILRHHEPANSPTCCQQLRGESAHSRARLNVKHWPVHPQVNSFINHEQLPELEPC